MNNAICYCGSKMDVSRKWTSSGMDGSYVNWHLYCPRCGIVKEYAADEFYGRKCFSTIEEAINEWNQNKAACLQKGQKEELKNASNVLMTREEIDKVIKKIREHCGNNSCQTCAARTDEYGCVFMSSYPNEWITIEEAESEET